MNREPNTRAPIETKGRRINGIRQQIGPRISKDVIKRLKTYCINNDFHMEWVIETAIRDFLKDKDTTTIVQTTLEFDTETDYNDPQYGPIKELLHIARNTMANRTGRMKLINRISETYSKLRKRVSIDPQLKMEVDSVLEILQEAK